MQSVITGLALGLRADFGAYQFITNALGQVTLRSYDANANESALTDALGRTTTFLYDELDRRSAWFPPRIRRAVCSIAKSDGQKILPFWADTKQAVS